MRVRSQLGLPTLFAALLTMSLSSTMTPYDGYRGWIMSVTALKHNYYTRRDERTFIGPLGYPFGFLDTGHYNMTVFDFELKAPKYAHSHDPHSRRSLAKNNKDATDTNNEDLGPDGPAEILKSIKGVGFLLKRFDDEAAFIHYVAWIQAESHRCIFQPFLDAKAANDDAMNQLMQDDNYAYLLDDDYMDDGKWMEDDAYDQGGDEDGGNPDDDRRQMRGFDQPRRQQVTSDGFGEVLHNASGDGIFLDMLSTSRWRPRTPHVAYDFQPGEAGFYFLMYQVCYKDDVNKNQNQLLDIHSRFELDFHFSNLDMFGKKSFLSAGEMLLPHLFFYFSLIYAICLFVWCKNIMNIKEGKPGLMDTGSPTAPVAPVGRGAQLPSVTVYPIHYLMGFLLSLKTCSLFFESIRYHFLRVTGHAVLWSAVYYTFAFLKGITLFTVILLIGSGWSFVKPFLSDREKKMIMAILVLQVINNIAIVVLTQETEGEHSFDRWTAILHLVDILCCCAVLIPIVWQVNQLEKNMEQDQHTDDDDEETRIFFDEDDEFDDEHIPEDEFENGTSTNGNANGTLFHPGKKPAAKVSRGPPDARLASKLKLFRSFYILVIAYIYITRIVVYLFAATLSYRHTWVRYLVVELVTLVFYVTVGMLFRPMNENPYLHVRRRGDQAGASGGKGSGQELEMRKIDPSTKAVID
ncbi:seven transmembrane receptor [Nitzschia inconspicua]|uniref:Seven transmembrane receptor n=1 Tax=Nitzschia inconspicua TaxID=303405 RepID=A0A9K3KEU8_9STRA|nr:seven transmembrane receptor [Nitzschia inconspicua]